MTAPIMRAHASRLCPPLSSPRGEPNRKSDATISTRNSALAPPSLHVTASQAASQAASSPAGPTARRTALAILGKSGKRAPAACGAGAQSWPSRGRHWTRRRRVSRQGESSRLLVARPKRFACGRRGHGGPSEPMRHAESSAPPSIVADPPSGRLPRRLSRRLPRPSWTGGCSIGVAPVTTLLRAANSSPWAETQAKSIKRSQ
mmetsp:Transcript_35378/g.79802  ORF Transcript_35378/g.79802 Transcript_35378/m.79802 type:complete len:203 (-) Transcript_35378:277-885(-)